MQITVTLPKKAIALNLKSRPVYILSHLTDERSLHLYPIVLQAFSHQSFCLSP
ncbi:MAG: hypothetical protein KME11_15470 [Timaviella obliquedivisa GSE-PSE-MK23-08B]|nr:hypothetical protein [Timaviella obliquedivisa GSE-PSE-MK23-08B]